VTESTGDC